jgi:hypothetical protein
LAAPTTGATSGELQIEIDWIEITDTDLDVETGLRLDGGKDIISYELSWDRGTVYLTGTADWTVIKGNDPVDMAVEYITTDVTAGVDYLFKVRAKNIHGWGPDSEWTLIAAADAPDAPPAVVTTIDPATGGIKVYWGPDTHDGSDEIETYYIEILNGDDLTNWADELTDCDGSDPVIVAQTYCIVPMSTWTDTFGYGFDEAVYARVSASNSYGFGPPSEQNTAQAAIRRVPD